MQVGRSRFSRCWLLISDLSYHLKVERGAGLTQSQELGFGFCLFALLGTILFAVEELAQLERLQREMTPGDEHYDANRQALQTAILGSAEDDCSQRGLTVALRPSGFSLSDSLVEENRK